MQSHHTCGLSDSYLGLLARHGREGLTLAGEPLVDTKDHAAQNDGDERDDVALSLNY